MKILALADVHLGRAPARLEAELRPRALELDPAAAWVRAVDAAVEGGVDAVFLAGDLVDSDDDLFEAYGELRTGIERLTARGISVVAVAGNHDHQVLPRLAAELPHLRLIGAGGKWETVDVPALDGSAHVRVIGWSFPSRWSNESPLSSLGFNEALNAARASSSHPPKAVFGLLHADRDAPSSQYAPVSGSQLREAPVDSWLLGHVHLPDLTHSSGPGPQLSGYLGSLTSTHPGEVGPRGAWLIEVGSDGRLAAEHLQLAPLRWERVSVDVSTLSEPARAEEYLLTELGALHEKLTAEGASPKAVGCRVTLHGRTRYRQALSEWLTRSASDLAFNIGGTRYFVERVMLTATPEMDLSRLAEGDDPVALIAARALALRDPDSPLRERLLAASRASVEELLERRDFAGVRHLSYSDEELLDLLEERALQTLDLLLQQADGRLGAHT